MHLLLTALLLAAPEDDPVVLARGKSFIVHGLTGPKGLRGSARPEPTVILHTALPSGKTRALLRSGTTIGLPIPMAIDRYPITQKRIAAVASDSERLYVLVWSASWRYEDFDGKGPVVKPPDEGNLELKVFWLEDGTEGDSIPLRGEKAPKMAPAESLEKGAIEVKEASVKVHGETLHFKGKKRVKPEE
jgi:hypothetical protein